MTKFNLKLSLLFLSATVLFGCLLLIFKYAPDFINLMENKEYFHLTISFLLFFILIILIKKFIINIESPIALIISGFVFFNLIGVVNSYIVEKIFLVTSMDVLTALAYVNYGIFSLLLGLLTVSSLPKPEGNKSSKIIYTWNLGKLKLHIFIIFWIAAISSVGFLTTGGGLLLLMDNPSSVYQVKTFQEVNPFFSKLYYYLFFFCTLISGIYLCLDKEKSFKKYLVLIVFFISLINLILTGKRSYMLIPLVTIFFCYNYYVKKINFKRFVLVGVLILSFLVAIGNIRSGGCLAREIGWSENILYSIGGEFTALSRVVYKFPEGKVFEKNTLFKSAVFPMLPRQIWNFLGFDKMRQLKLSGLTISSLLFGNLAHSGIRIGIIGELFLEFGLWGILVGMFAFGAILGVLNRAIRNSYKSAANLLIYNFVLSIMLYMIIGQFDGAFSYLYYNIYLLFALYLFCRRRTTVA